MNASIATKRSLPIMCPQYDAIPGTKRCRHYHPNGACGLSDGFMCIEWLKVNGHAAPQPSAVPTPPPLTRTLFEDVVPPAASPPAKSKPSTPPPPLAPPSAPTPSHASPGPAMGRVVSDKEIASFKALDVEVCMTSEALGDVWLVPSYTGADRRELSVEHAALIAAVCSAFPGARVTAFEKKRST